jgi:anti-sigma B factor antagonist
LGAGVELEDARVDEQVVGPELVLSTKQDGDRAVVTIRGELDAYSAPSLDEQIARLLRDNAKLVVIDLSETAFLDSSGLRAILTAQRRVTDAQGELTLRNPSEPVTRLLEITGLTDHFTTES